MTPALCLRCGETKFGAWCPCFKCGAEASGDEDLEIAFSDQMMIARTIKGFGAVIKAIRQGTNDPDVVLWTFIAYVTRHHSEILTAKLPPEIASRADDLLDRLDLPEVKLIPGRLGNEAGSSDQREGYSVLLPPEQYRAFSEAHPFTYPTPVELLLRNGSNKRRCLLVKEADGGHVVGVGQAGLKTADVVGIRPTRGWFSWFSRKQWIRLKSSDLVSLSCKNAGTDRQASGHLSRGDR
jgi:hypothetical protein